MARDVRGRLHARRNPQKRVPLIMKHETMIFQVALPFLRQTALALRSRRGGQ